MGLVVVVVKPLLIVWFLFPLAALVTALRLIGLLTERGSVALWLRVAHLDLAADDFVVVHVPAFFHVLQ